jgi:hypothetical protein
VNDPAYARRLRENQLADHLHDDGSHYIIQNQYPRNNVLVDVVTPPPANFRI